MDAADWNARYASTDLVWSAEPNRFVREIVESWPAGRSIDVACGEGRNAIWLAGQGWDSVGVDYSDVAIDKARRLAESRGVSVDFRCVDATTAPLETGAYDLVLLCYLQLPADEIAATVAAAVPGIRPGGALLFIAHALDNLDHGVGGPQSPDVLYTPEQIAALAAAAGLAVERAEHVRRPVEMAEGTRDAIDLVVIARAA